MPTVAELLRATDRMPGEEPARDLEVLLGHCLGRSRTWLFTWPETEVIGPELAAFQALRARRERGEPVAHLVGRRDFWTLSLAVDDSTLIPRPDTETLVEWALSLPLPATATALDLGTGTGAIALALACERPDWQVVAVDASAAAVALATRNAADNSLERVQVMQSDWFAALGARRFQLVVANPPYIDAGDPHLARGDLRFEPTSALVAAEQGLADLRHLVANAPAHLVDGGWLLLEHGFEQGATVRGLLAGAGFADVTTRRDLGGQERVSGGRYRC